MRSDVDDGVETVHDDKIELMFRLLSKLDQEDLSEATEDSKKLYTGKNFYHAVKNIKSVR